ncbi:hypothetical protein M5K25_004774 [Dendrobium thyrsiflorum]|uniref:Uncharacterized protein n=1 Tax=Dendrobium thyrsiflorum TaxID=117978 RepID=A0ABD0VG74_DENTH
MTRFILGYNEEILSPFYFRRGNTNLSKFFCELSEETEFSSERFFLRKEDLKLAALVNHHKVEELDIHISFH